MAFTPTTAGRYGDGTNSSIGDQPRTEDYMAQAFLTLERDHFQFSQLASIINQPKHMGKACKRDIYLPILEDENRGTHGLDVNGNQSAQNLYGSSKDISDIKAKQPLISEEGDAANRVYITRKQITGNLQRYGIHTTFTDESIDFDSSPALAQQIRVQLAQAAEELVEDRLGIDLNDAASTIHYCGSGTSYATLSGATTDIDGNARTADVLSHESFIQLGKMLKKVKAKRQNQILTGSTYVGTTPVDPKFNMIIHSDLIMDIKRLKNMNTQEPLFIPFHAYGSQTKRMPGEIGMIEDFRIIEGDRMHYRKGVGDSVPDGDTSFYEEGGKYNAYDLLVIGDDAFNTIGFMHGNKNRKFNITEKSGSELQSIDHPYSGRNLISLEWYYGTLINRPEHIAKLVCVARK